MKKWISLVALTALMTINLSAQDVLFTAKLEKEDVPTVVISSMESDYPGMEITSYQAVPLEFIGEDWIVHPNMDNFTDKNYSTYVVSFSGSKLKGEATYDSDGNLISAQEELKDVPLPHTMQTAIAADYPGWAMSKDHVVMTLKRDGQKKVYYKVELTKGKEMKKVVYDGNANEVKAGKTHDHLG
ncbi:MAG: hypothetical protein R2824_12485 [Saprospiraceae bacterium]|nr:hypothetical protein [Lewinella sp.]